MLMDENAGIAKGYTSEGVRKLGTGWLNREIVSV